MNSVMPQNVDLDKKKSNILDNVDDIRTEFYVSFLSQFFVRKIVKKKLECVATYRFQTIYPHNLRKW